MGHSAMQCDMAQLWKGVCEAMKKITKLTPEQEASIPEFRAKWISLGESTKRSSPQEMRDAVNNLHDAIGEKRVPVFVMDSPLGCVVAANA
jgi:uncharacterized lipoprotein YddW (UPF0748 family)